MTQLPGSISGCKPVAAWATSALFAAPGGVLAETPEQQQQIPQQQHGAGGDEGAGLFPRRLLPFISADTHAAEKGHALPSFATEGRAPPPAALPPAAADAAASAAAAPLSASLLSSPGFLRVLDGTSSAPVRAALVAAGCALLHSAGGIRALSADPSLANDVSAAIRFEILFGHFARLKQELLRANDIDDVEGGRGGDAAAEPERAPPSDEQHSQLRAAQEAAVTELERTVAARVAWRAALLCCAGGSCYSGEEGGAAVTRADRVAALRAAAALLTVQAPVAELATALGIEAMRRGAAAGALRAVARALREPPVCAAGLPGPGSSSSGEAARGADPAASAAASYGFFLRSALLTGLATGLSPDGLALLRSARWGHEAVGEAISAILELANRPPIIKPGRVFSSEGGDAAARRKKKAAEERSAVDACAALAATLGPAAPALFPPPEWDMCGFLAAGKTELGDTYVPLTRLLTAMVWQARGTTHCRVSLALAVKFRPLT